jgi:hypothetical protein
MRLVLRTRSTSTKSWRELLGSPPASLWRAETADGGLVIARPDDEHAVTGLRLTRDNGAPALALPLFCGSSDLSLAEQLTPMVARALGGDLEIEGRIVAAADFQRSFEEEIAPRFIHQSMDRFKSLLGAEDKEVWTIEGYRRPYFVGVESARRALGLAGGDLSEGYLRLLTIVASIQRIDAGTTSAVVRTIRTPDGAEARYAVWDPRRETLLPPCDYALVAGPVAGSYVRVAVADLERVVTVSPGVMHGARFDEVQWLLGQLDEASAEAVRARAREVGKTLRIPPGVLDG